MNDEQRRQHADGQNDAPNQQSDRKFSQLVRKEPWRTIMHWIILIVGTTVMLWIPKMLMSGS